ncbi:MAG: putative heme-binding domain-containing protein [Verrucomicrobiales bacterium]|jgi:putative heme-binding domain-containing protein
MKKTIFLILSGLGILPAAAQDASGIKAANIAGADLELMRNHDPNVEREHFNLLPGYEANLFAQEPMLANPIHMVWDSRGRLWVACSWAYPQLKPGEVADDKIIILEDTDDDGVADKSTIFADGLYMPTGIELANGGCFVAQTPDVFFLKDTDGDDVADVKELALTGFGIEDSHHSISAWRRGPGGWIYFQEGIFLHSQVETLYGVVRNYNGGVYQFNPRTQELRVFCSGQGGNPWGHVFDRWGQSFMVNNPRVTWLTPSTGNSGRKVPLNPLISTEKQCGGDIASGTHLGDELRGQLLTCRFKSRAIVRYDLVDDDSGFSAAVQKPLISSRHPNFRPVDCKVGPDGALYVADWYNSIINHGQHDFRDPRRDHEHGRIWRITHKTRPLAEKPDLVGASTQQLLNHLKSPEGWTRHQARKELSERDGDEVLREIEKWAATATDDHDLVEALWACQNVERVSEEILTRVLAAKDGHARAAGARVIRYWHNDLSDPILMIAKLAADDFPRVRLEALLSAGFIPQPEALPAALHVLDHPRDGPIDIALPQTVAALESLWVPKLESGELEFAKPAHREFAEQAAGIGFDRRLAEFLKQKDPSASDVAEVRKRLIGEGTERQFQTIVNALTAKRNAASPKATAAMLEALREARKDREFNAGRKVVGLRAYLANEDVSIASAAAGALGIFKVRQAGPDLISLLSDQHRTAGARRAAAGALTEMDRSEFFNQLKALALEGPIETRFHAVSGLIKADVVEAAGVARVLLAEDPGKADPAALILDFAQRRQGDSALAEALAGAKIHPDVIAKVAEFHRQTGRVPRRLTGFFQPETGGSLSATLLEENREALTTAVIELGDPARGELIFRRKKLACAACHAIGPAGPAIGPNLVAVGAAAGPEYMVESILEPNTSIAEHFETRMFTLVDDSIRVGVITSKTDDEIVVLDSTQAGREIRIPTVEIRRQQTMPSLMPAGLADQLRDRQEFLDLSNFLAVLGKPGPYANDESPVIRKWRVADSNESESAWIPAYSMVNGELPIEDFPAGDTVFARGFVNVLSAGAIALKVNQSAGLQLWIDDVEIPDLSEPIQLEPGRRIFTFRIDHALRERAGLRVELVPGPSSEVRFQTEGGL